VSVLTSKQFARRWRDCNRLDTFFTEVEEDAWRTSNLELLAKAHTLGGITDLTFEVIESHYAVIGVSLSLNYHDCSHVFFPEGFCFRAGMRRL